MLGMSSLRRLACVDTKLSLLATVRSVAISGFWHEIASSKFSIFPRNDGLTY
ncbi:hypothetical protein RAMDARK_0194 [Rickettsia amblyommatis str. Darkwater]|uniref:Uncharacterized protein n=1 Tax=Rickettsia amblyommatis str. Ac/Pa TaxID=1359164 RepID=A0A0F3N049_RICAM|nr:hypothetical protein APHACPA_0424 [Rickettsia amblyommatis str. Ac/Pa]KJV97689.1 hypothetical protein RAMDARK_0194 [Rickettsia amblyommatis str. Darkwater]